MAILVSNPSTVQFTGAPAEPQDPASTPLDAGFTEELANAMQSPAQLTEGANSAPKPILQGVDAKLNDLQILPPDVLLNAVGEANFAFANQGTLASDEAALAQDASGLMAETPFAECFGGYPGGRNGCCCPCSTNVNSSACRCSPSSSDASA